MDQTACTDTPQRPTHEDRIALLEKQLAELATRVGQKFEVIEDQLRQLQETVG